MIEVKFVNDSISILDYLPSVIAIISIISTIVITWLQHKYYIQQNKKVKMYEEKKAALFKTLEFLSNYISWLTPSSGIKPLRVPYTTERMTLEARECYDLLCIYCEDQDIIDLFWDIVGFDHNHTNSNVYEKYSIFRDKCCKELEIYRQHKSRSEYISIVTTDELMEVEKE